jgi:hypothetical protein
LLLGRIVVVIGALAALAAATAFLSGTLSRGTTAGSLAGRAAIGLGLGLLLIVIVHRMLRALAEPPPPPHPTIDARATEVVYECPVCGTRVRLELAATAKAPKHCGEEMEARIG